MGANQADYNGDFPSASPTYIIPQVNISGNYQSDEPQLIAILPSNTSSIFIDSSHRDGAPNSLPPYSTVSSVYNCRISKFRIDNAIRIKFRLLSYQYLFHNVNVRNNTIRFFSTATGFYYSVTVPEDTYSTALLLIDAVVLALNTVSGSSGLVFSQTVANAANRTYNLIAAGAGSYFVDPLCSMAVKGIPLINLPLYNPALGLPPPSSQLVGPIRLFSTNFIDISSVDLVRHGKVFSTSNTGFSNNGLLVRYTLNDPVEGTQRDLNSTEGTWINWDNRQSLTYFTLKFTDQFGDIVYTSPDLNNSAFWACQIICQR